MGVFVLGGGGRGGRHAAAAASWTSQHKGWGGEWLAAQSSPSVLAQISTSILAFQYILQPLSKKFNFYIRKSYFFDLKTYKKLTSFLIFLD